MMPFIKKKKAITEELPKGEVKEESPKELKKELLAETKKLGLSDQVAEMNEKLDLIAGIKKKEAKKFKLKGFSVNKLKRLNKGKNRAILMLGSNGGVTLLKGEFMQGMVKVGENYYDASAMYVWQFKKANKFIPFYIIFESSIRPISREEVYTKAKDDNTLIDSQIITLRAMKQEQFDKGVGKKIGGGAWIGIAIAAAVIIFMIFGGNK